MTTHISAAVVAILAAVSPVLSWQQSAAPIHVLKISSGPAGVEEKGTFRFTEERTTFTRTDHREVIVHFQWEGVPGRHRLEATWRAPGGGSSTSVIDYLARDRRFGAYWRMPVSPDMPLGSWSIEATVDGQPGGRLNFEITDATSPETAPAKKVRRVLTQQELYDRLAGAFVVLTRTAPNGRELETGGAVVGGEGRIFTASRLLDEVGRIQGVFGNRATQHLTDVVDLHRQEGWAILSASTGPAVSLRRTDGAPSVGDRCYSMHGPAAGARVLVEGQITGRTEKPAGGWIVSFVNGAGTAGSPVVNEYGEILGILGTGATEELRLIRTPGSTFEFGNLPMIPIGSIAARVGATTLTLDALRARGDLLEPLVGDTHVVSGGFATRIGRTETVHPEDQRQEFSTRDKEFSIFVTWSPRERLKGHTAFKVYDAANRLVAASKLAKIDFRKTTLVLSSLRVPTFQVAGVYRAEIHLNDKPAWRDYVRIVP